MPSPFPGMDPYLEHPTRWQGAHLGLITYASAALNALLPPAYVADIGERLYVVQPERSIYPDVVVVERPPAPLLVDHGTGGAAVAVASDPHWVLTVQPVEMREAFIRIVSTADESQVITVIEVLSPSNKTPGSEGRELYLAKQHELLRSPTHLIEIDLLREGEHTVAPPRHALLEKGRWDYLVSLHRGGHRGEYVVWPIPLQERLPRILVPLRSGDPDIVLDLQPVFDRCYDEGAYARRLDYSRGPRVRLRGDDVEWADRLLRERGLRG
jgi:hypothetical protein